MRSKCFLGLAGGFLHKTTSTPGEGLAGWGWCEGRFSAAAAPLPSPRIPAAGLGEPPRGRAPHFGCVPQEAIGGPFLLGVLLGDTQPYIVIPLGTPQPPGFLPGGAHGGVRGAGACKCMGGVSVGCVRVGGSLWGVYIRGGLCEVCTCGGVSVGCVHMGGAAWGLCGVSVLAHGCERVRPHTLAPLYRAARHAGKRSSPAASHHRRLHAGGLHFP